MAKKRDRKPITEEQRKILLQRLELARAKNPDNNPALRPSSIAAAVGEQVSTDNEHSVNGLSPYLSQYLSSEESIRDFKRLRRESPKDALVLAIDRVWGAKSGVGKGKENKVIAILIKSLTGFVPIPERNETPQHIVVEADVQSDTDKGL